MTIDEVINALKVVRKDFKKEKTFRNPAPIHNKTMPIKEVFPTH